MNALFQGIILTGGQSKRMGHDKASLKYKGTDFLSYEINILNKNVERLMIVGDSTKYKGYGISVVDDIFSGKGPAGGIYTGLVHSNQDYNFVLSCDVPQIGNELILLLMDTYNGEDALICSHQGKIHPLVGIYNTKTRQHFKNSIDSGKLKLHQILKEMDSKFLDVPENLAHQITNINTKKEYTAFIRKPSE